MKKKILYILTTAALITAAFFVGKSAAQETIHADAAETFTPENQEIESLTATEYGLQITYTDGTGVWIESEDLEKAGLISTENIIDWNTDGKELSIMTGNGYEYYGYKTENIYQNRAFVPVEGIEK